MLKLKDIYIIYYYLKIDNIVKRWFRISYEI